MRLLKITKVKKESTHDFFKDLKEGDLIGLSHDGKRSTITNLKNGKSKIVSFTNIAGELHSRFELKRVE